MNEIVKGMSPEKWPSFIVKWDESNDNLHLYADGEDSGYIVDNYKHGIVIADVSLRELDCFLCETSRQSLAEFWDIGKADKKIGVIEHWVNGGEITPCMVSPFEGEIYIVGGNHRLAVARAKGEEIVPILFDNNHSDKIRAIIKTYNLRVPS